MSDEIKVTVCKYPDRTNLVLRYIDPVTGRQKTKSAGTPDEAKAIGKAAVWEDELQTGRYVAPSKVTWAEFRKRYEDEKSASLSLAVPNVRPNDAKEWERLLRGLWLSGLRLGEALTL